MWNRREGMTSRMRKVFQQFEKHADELGNVKLFQTDVGKATGIPQGQVNTAVQALRDRGLIRHLGYGHYAIRREHE